MANDIDNNILEEIERVCSRAKEVECATINLRKKKRLFDLVQYLDKWKQGCQEQLTAHKDEFNNQPDDYPPDEEFQLEE